MNFEMVLRVINKIQHLKTVSFYENQITIFWKSEG
jgi:hypothetical protein